MLESIFVSAAAGASLSLLFYIMASTDSLAPPTGCATSVLSNPIWVVNVRLASSRRPLSSRSLTPFLARRPGKPCARRSRPTPRAARRPRRSSRSAAPSGRRSSTSSARTVRAPSSTASARRSSSSRTRSSSSPSVLLLLESRPPLPFKLTPTESRPQLFEQLKNLILRRRALRLTKGSAGAPPLTDLDFFLLGAVTKLFATSVTYPCASRRRSLARACDRRVALLRAAVAR